MNTTVLQNWVVVLPLRMQSTLLLSLRGPDTHECPNVKKITRWLRGHTFKPGNPANVKEFMGADLPVIGEKGPTAKELEFCSQHFYSHLMHGLEVVTYMHPSQKVSNEAGMAFRAMCNLMHLPPEDPRDFMVRLEHIEWPGGRQPDTFFEAMEILGIMED